MGERSATSLLEMGQKAVCAGCHRPIREQFLLRVNGGLWHEECVRCAVCGSSLENTCFLRDHKLYCKRDYIDLFAVRCGGCAEVISPADLVMRAGSAVFHLRCFACSACSCRLQTGDRCVLRDGQLLCARDHYHRCLASPACSETDKSDEEEEEEEEGGEREEAEKAAGRPGRREELESSKRPKRPRTILTTQQRRAFKASFEVSSKPCRKVRETLATETGLSVRVVQVWFQNQRAKMKKLARRQQQQDQQTQKQQVDQSSHGTDTIMSLKVPPCGDLTPNQDPLGSSSYHHHHHYHQHHHHPHPHHHHHHHPHPHPHPHQEQHLGLTRLDPQGFDMDPFRQGLTPPQMPGDHMNPYGLYGDTLEGDVLCPLADNECLSLGDSSLLTPIDRLYSMQDSYFTS